MSFASLFNEPVTPKKAGAATGFGSLFDTTSTDAQLAEKKKIAKLTAEASAAKEASDKANSVSGIFKQTLSNIWESTKTYVADSAKQAFSFEKSLLTNPVATYKKAVGGFSDAIIEHASQGFDNGVAGMSGLFEDYKKGTGSTAGDVANLARILSGTAGVLFSPISGTISGAQKVPVLRQIADVINAPATVLDIGARYSTGAVFDAIPEQYLSPASKEILKQPIGDLASLAAQIVIGSKVMGKIADVAERGGRVTPAEATRIVDEVKKENDAVFKDDGLSDNPSTHDPVAASTLTPAERHAQYAKSQGYEPYVPADQLPVIEAGKKTSVKSDLPVIKANAPTVPKVKGDLEYIPVPNEPGLPPQEPITIVRKPAVSRETPKNTPNNKDIVIDEKPKVPGTEENKIAGLAKSVEADAIANDLASSFGQLPEYRRMDMKEQSQRALDLIKRDPEQALEVALGNRIPDDPGLLSESVYTAMRVLARDAGDVAMLRRLAVESHIVSDATALGQRIKALDSGITNDPVSIIQDVKAARQRTVEKKAKDTVVKAKEKIVDEIKTEIKKSASKRQAWEEFIQEIQCTY